MLKKIRERQQLPVCALWPLCVPILSASWRKKREHVRLPPGSYAASCAQARPEGSLGPAGRPLVGKDWAADDRTEGVEDGEGRASGWQRALTQTRICADLLLDNLDL